MAIKTPTYRAEVVGSLLRPPELVAARHKMRSGEMAREEYRAIEDRAVDDALGLQEEIGLDAVTDGEMRRDIFFDFLIKGLTGLQMKPSDVRVRFRNRESENVMEVPIPCSVVDKVTALECPALDELRYARERTQKPLNVTLPSPGIIAGGFWGEPSKDAYPDPPERIADVGEAVKQWVSELAAAGCEYIQLDAPDLIDLYCDERIRAEYEQRGVPALEARELGTQLAVEIGEVERGAARLGMHLCRGNGTQSWIAEGGYDEFAEHVFKRATGYDVFTLEYDDERSGGFEPLRELPDDKVAALGLVSTKWTRIEDPDELKARIAEAARYHPMERLALAPQCGFASAAETAEQRKLRDQTQREKLELVVRVAREVWQ